MSEQDAISKLVSHFDARIAEKDRRIERLEEALRQIAEESREHG